MRTMDIWSVHNGPPWTVQVFCFLSCLSTQMTEMKHHILIIKTLGKTRLLIERGGLVQLIT